MAERSLEELLAGYQRAEMAAFEEFYERTHRLLFNYLLAKTQRQEDAEEALQLAYLKIHRHVTSYDPGRNALAWCFTIARNALIDVMTKTSREELDATVEGTAQNRTTEALEARQELTRLLADLSDEERIMIERRFLNEESLEEMAADMGLRPATLRQRMSRLLRRLKI